MQEIEYISGHLQCIIGSDNVYLGDISVPNQTLHLGKEVYIPIFNSAEWDGIVGLGFTPEDPTITETSYPTLVDNLESYKEIKNKFFSFYLPDENGFITFGEIPSSIVSDVEKINWAPLIPNNENPWSVRLSDIIIQQTP